jgi:hypothetical protein
MEHHALGAYMRGEMVVIRCLNILAASNRRVCRHGKQNVLDILEFSPFYRDITSIVQNEANITRKISKLQIISHHADMRSEKKLQASLSDQIRVSKMELQKQSHFTAIYLSQLSQTEVALDNQSASFESEFGAQAFKSRDFKKKRTHCMRKK